MFCWFSFITGTVRLRFRKSIFIPYFQNTRKLDNNYFQYHRDVIYSVLLYILTFFKKICFFPHAIFFLWFWFFILILMENFVIFLKCSLNSRAHALQLELTKVWYTNFGKFRLQSMSSKMEQAFETMTKNIFCLHFANSNFSVIYFALSL